MFSSQALEVAIGLTLVFFFFAAATSAIVEAISGLFQKRAKDLEEALKKMLGNADPNLAPGVPKTVLETSVYSGISVGSKRLIGTARPSYVSAKAFADSVAEIIAKTKAVTSSGEDLYDALPSALRDRLQPIVTDVKGDATAIKAELEAWFDETMDRLEGSYKRWAQMWLFVLGLSIVIFANASTYRIALSLYNDPAVRSAVTESATATAGASTDESSDPASIKEAINTVSETVDDLDSLGLPIGWENWDEPGGSIGTVAGWFVTAFLIMLGAPFWFGLLTKLVPLRSAGDRPPPASDQIASATAKRNGIVK